MRCAPEQVEHKGRRVSVMGNTVGGQGAKRIGRIMRKHGVVATGVGTWAEGE
jgi:hypothetical protein